MKKSVIHLMLLAGLLSATGAHAYTIDGNLADWGMQKNGNVADWTPNSGIHYTVEDQHSSYLNPGYGGQAYDAEAIYVSLDSTNLYIALATGHNPNTAQNPGGNSFGAGDFAIDFGKDGSYEVGINIKPAWDGFGVAGGIYGNAAWNYGLWNTAGNYDPAHPDPTNPTFLESGDLIGLANLAYTTSGANGYGAWTNDLHYFYEIALPLAYLNTGGWNGESFNVHWTQNCANDTIIVDPPSNVPEPGTLALLPLGMLGLIALRRRTSA